MADNSKAQLLVDEVANELRHYRHSPMSSGALAEHILAIPRIHDALTRPQPSTSSVEAVARAIYESLDLSFELKDDMARDGEFAKAAEAVVAALSPEREPMREALEAARAALTTYDCGKSCSYLKGRHLINGRCPRDFEGSCGKIARDCLVRIAALAPPPSTIGRSEMSELPHNVRRALKVLTPAQAEALANARYGETLGGFFLPGSTRLDVRRRLQEAGLLGKRSHVLTTVGLGVRAELQRRASADQ